MSVGIADSPDIAGRTKVGERSLCGQSSRYTQSGWSLFSCGKLQISEGSPGQAPQMVSRSLAHLADAWNSELAGSEMAGSCSSKKYGQLHSKNRKRSSGGVQRLFSQMLIVNTLLYRAFFIEWYPAGSVGQDWGYIPNKYLWKDWIFPTDTTKGEVIFKKISVRKGLRIQKRKLISCKLASPGDVINGPCRVLFASSWICVHLIRCFVSSLVVSMFIQYQVSDLISGRLHN